MTLIDNKKFTQRILISLSWLRAIALMMQVIYMLWFIQPINLLVWVLIVIQLCLLLSGWINQKLRLSERAILINLLFDLLLLGGYVYFTGGVTNPLISLLLLPVVTASVALKRSLALSVLVIGVGVYSGLYFFEPPQHHHGSNFSSHLLGMWLVFIASGALLFYVTSYLSKAIRQQQERIQRHERRQLRDDYLTALGLSAADAAHQLNTPLSTLSVLLDDASEEKHLDREDLEVMQQQVQRCQLITQSIQQQFNEFKSGEFRVTPIAELTSKLTSSFRLLYPDIQLIFQDQTDLEGIGVKSHIGLQSALLNLLDNAAKASLQVGKSQLELTVSNDQSYCFFDITDQGKGLAPELLEDYGWRPYSSNGKDGMGVGTLISNASIEQTGGYLKVLQHSPGTKVRVGLPLVQTQEVVGRNGD